MEQSVESNFFKKFKAIASLPIPRPYFRFFFLKKNKKTTTTTTTKRFLRKSSKPGWTWESSSNYLNCLELHSTLSEKKIFVANFPFLMDSLYTPASPSPLSPLKSTPLSPIGVTKVFCQCFLTVTYHGFSRLGRCLLKVRSLFSARIFKNMMNDDA